MRLGRPFPNYTTDFSVRGCVLAPLTHNKQLFNEAYQTIELAGQLASICSRRTLTLAVSELRVFLMRQAEQHLW